jgi:hypothetical protein
MQNGDDIRYHNIIITAAAAGHRGKWKSFDLSNGGKEWR